MKRLVCVLTAVLICMSFLPAYAAETGVSVYVDGEKLQARGYLVGGTSYIPVRSLCEHLGYSVTWRDSDKSVLISGNGVSARLTRGGDSYTENGQEYPLGGISDIKSGTFYAPARALSKIMSLEITWDGKSKSVLYQSPEPYASDEVYWLSRIISAEAQGESLEGQIAVGNVVLNRVKSPDFPNTIWGVIFDTNFGVQFTPTVNGTIYNTPTSQSIEAAKLCLSGVSVAPDCLYFFNPELSTAHYWIINNRTFCQVIGNHHFYD